MNSQLKQPPNCPQIRFVHQCWAFILPTDAQYGSYLVHMENKLIVGSVAMRAWILERDKIRMFLGPDACNGETWQEANEQVELWSKYAGGE